MSREIADFLTEKGVPAWLQEELVQAYTVQPVALGPFEFSSVAELIYHNTGEPYGVFCDSGYLNLAYGPSGDHIATELATGMMFIVNHDEFWEYYSESGVTHPPDVRTRMINPNLDFNAFWLRAALEPDFPCDAYEAEEIWPRYMQETDGTIP
ncbi:hypothetical protein [Aureliella helgolandensis]|nr:hypothetical protein [Aureliella helgolandensis]